MSPALSADSSARARRLLAPFAWLAVFLTFVVIVASAFIRHTQAGLDCADWPACYARVSAESTAEADAESPSTGVRVARSLHRIAASSALLVILGILLLARATESEARARTLAIAALVLAVGLAVLGVATRGARLPAVPLGNLLGGYLMLAVLAALAGSVAGAAARTDVASGASAAAGTQRHAASPVYWLAWTLLALAFMQAVLGGLIGTQFALRSCATLDRCVGAASDAFATGAALDPFRRPDVVAGHFVPPAGAAGLHVMHRWLAVVITLGALTLAFALRSTQRRAAALLAALALAASLLGVAAILRMPALTATVLHNAAAALLVGTLAFVLARRARSNAV